MHTYDDKLSNEANTLEFVNRYRDTRGLPTLAAMPDPVPEAHPKDSSPLAQALGVSIFRCRETTVFSDTADGAAVVALKELGCSHTPYRPNRIDDTKRYDVRLPWYTWSSAGSA